MSWKFARRALSVNLAGFVFLIAGCGSAGMMNGLASNNLSASGHSLSVRGLWAYNGNSIAASSSGAENIRDFAVSQHINEIYISALPNNNTELNDEISNLISVLHQSTIHVEALIGSSTADEPGAPRDALLAIVQAILQFDQQYPETQFDGIHLDIEPQQRPENSGANALQFVPNLIETYSEVNALAAPANLVVNADIPVEVLRASLDQRESLFTALPRFTLMLYGVSSQSSGQSVQQEVSILQQASQKYLSMAYNGLNGENLATLAIGLNTADYGYALMPTMLSAVDQSNATNTHYPGWSCYSYSDYQEQQNTHP
jgi:hypothetical protein